MTSHRLSAAYQSLLAFKQPRQSYRFKHIALMRARGMSIYVVDISCIYSSITQSPRHGYIRSIIARLAYASAIARKSISAYFGKNGCASLHCMLIALKHQSCCSSTWHKAITILIKRARRPCGLIHTLGECTQCIKRRHGIFIYLLSSTTQNHILQALLNQQICQTYAVTATCACGAYAKIHTAQMKHRAHIHIHR